MLFARDRRNGRWYGSRFIYDRPALVATFRCKPTGQPQFHPFRFDEAEPNALVYYIIEVENDPPTKLYSATVVGNVVNSAEIAPGRGATRGGISIRNDKSADLLITILPEAISMTVRIYMRNFTIGRPDDQDGDPGEFREAFRIGEGRTNAIRD